MKPFAKEKKYADLIEYCLMIDVYMMGFLMILI